MTNTTESKFKLTPKGEAVVKAVKTITDGDNLPTEVILLATEKAFEKLQIEAQKLGEMIHYFNENKHNHSKGIQNVMIQDLCGQADTILNLTKKETKNERK